MAKELNGKTVTKAFMEKATACGKADELMKLAEAEGYKLTKEEAEAFLAEVSEVELGDEVLEKAAGGSLGYYRMMQQEQRRQELQRKYLLQR